MILHCFWAFLTLEFVVLAEDPEPLVIPGHVTIGVLTHLRQDDKSQHCRSPIKSWALQEVAALEWALTTINNQSNKEFAVGLQVYDNCGNKDRLTRQTVNLLKNAENATNPLIGIISLGDLPSISIVSSLLHAYSLPLMTAQAPSERILEDDNVFTTAPHLHAHMQAVLLVLSRQRRHSGILEHRLGVVSGCHIALQTFESIALKAGVDVHSTILIDASNKTKLTEDTTLFLKSQVGFQGTVILLLHTSSINHLIGNLDPILIKRAESFWIFSLLDGEPTENALNFRKLSASFHMSVIVEPFSPLLPGLNFHLSNSLSSSTSVISHITSMIQPKKLCSSTNLLHSENCAGGKNYPLLSGTRATSVIKAISTLVAAFRLVQIDRCPHSAECRKVFEGEIGPEMVQSLMKLSYNAQETSDNIRYTADGRFLTSFIISKAHSTGLQQVGKYREDTGIIWTHPLPGMKSRQSRSEILNPEDEQSKPYSKDDEHSDKSDDFLEFDEFSKDDSIIREILYSQPDRIGMFYALSVLIWASTGILIALYTAAYLALKTWDVPVTSSKLMESILLIGVIACFASCMLFVLPPTLVMCRLRIMMPSISLSICFGVILLTTMQLRASETLGKVREVSKTNLYVTLMFIVGIQMALSLISQKDLLDEKRSTPVVELGPNGIRMCRRETLPCLITQEYLLILLVFSKVLGLTNLNVTKGNSEDRRLLQVSAFATVLIVIWMILTISAPTCTILTGTCIICLTLATSILIALFGPKMIFLMNQAKQFKHKKLAASSISHVLKPVETLNSDQTVRPPPPFCDPPHLRGNKFYNIPPMRPWRLDAYDSPILRYSIPPPPPPPVKEYYCNRSNVFYP